MGYTKNIAVIKGLKDGFSADGGQLTGLIKAERYSGILKVEASLLNFAPLSEGRYVIVLSDGPHTEIIENCYFEGKSELDSSEGFAAVVCYVNGEVRMIASAVCGDFHGAAFGLKEVLERTENSKKEPVAPTEKPDYEDEAVAEENYYEFDKTDEGGEPVCESPEKEENRRKSEEDENASCRVEEPQNGAAVPKLARGGFYEKMRAEIEGLLSAYPACEELCSAIPQSKWIKIDYGDGKYYVFGVISADGKPRYICYGVPSASGKSPPASMAGMAAFLPLSAEGGYWVMYQDADTGAGVHSEQV